jgi:hypothetical protein
MSEPQLTFHELSQRLRLRALPVGEPSADLWQRIVDTHQLHVRHTRIRRGIVGASFVAAALVAFLLIPDWQAPPPADGAVDWQARAQALELQLHALAAGTPMRADGGALEAQLEIARIDGALQSAYDVGAGKSQLAPLWKRRSELLDMLISVRQQRVEISRI